MTGKGNKWDSVWEKVFRNQAWGKYPAEELIRFVARNYYNYKAKDRATVRFLELGCGPGANLWYLAREGFGFVGIDGSPTAIEQAGARLDMECPGWRSRGELRVGDISTIPYADESFDAVIDSECVCCNDFATSKRIYSEARRVTKRGGGLFVRTFSSGSWGDGSGASVGHHAWECSEGPLAGKGFARFTSLEEIPDLLDGYDNLDIELLTWTMNERRNAVKEWIITVAKSAISE